MLAQERRNIILEELQNKKKVIVSELGKTFQVSEETIRRDLEKLANDGFAIKSYGGATLNENTNIDLPFNIRKKHNTSQKQKIAKLFENLIDDGDYITIDASSTAIFIARAIKHKKNLTIITNSIEIMFELSDMDNWQVISTGGNLKMGYLALVGPQVSESIKDYHVEKSILSCKGIDREKGITDGSHDFAQVKKSMINSANKNILAVDSTKFDQKAFIVFDNFKQVDIVVTDKKPSDLWLEFFATKNIECIYQ